MDIEGDVLKTPIGVPQSFEYEKDSFYVRPCYDEYYRQILDLLKRYRYISVTGTPGIGKSLFYLYFLERYRAENPKRSVVTAAFSKARDLKECVLFRHDGSYQKCKDIDCDLYLYDGPPKVEPVGVNMIAFTSPNFDWLDSMEKHSAHRLVFMPVWDIGELQNALETLELKIEDEVLEERFAFFGGSARYCLSTDLRFVLKGRDKVNKALGKIEGFEMVKDCFDGNLDLNTIVHRLMYYRPDDPERDFALLFPASVEISMMLKSRLDKKLSNERAKLLRWLDGAGKASVFSGWLFENFVHEILLDGGDFQIRSLDK